MAHHAGMEVLKIIDLLITVEVKGFDLDVGWTLNDAFEIRHAEAPFFADL